MKNIFKTGAWLCGILSALLLLLGAIAILTGQRLFNNWGSTYWSLSGNIILFGILLLLFYVVYEQKKA